MTPKLIGALVALGSMAGMAEAAGDLPTRFSNRGGIINTRHNMTQRQPVGGPTGVSMDSYRNDYQEVCVYCHTPHGSNSTVSLPLWNRTIKATTYTTYNQLGTVTLTQEVSQPGNNSLACLSCHDGQTAIDAVINMPGAGLSPPAPQGAPDTNFLDRWNNASGLNAYHLGLRQDECLVCHTPGPNVFQAGAADFTLAAIGTDLRNDHPVGVVFPEKNGAGTDFNTPAGRQGNARFFDSNQSGTMDSNEVRLYATNSKFQVECASCHDPHGVPSAGRGSAFFPTFLRVANAGSALCLTCHAK